MSIMKADLNKIKAHMKGNIKSENGIENKKWLVCLILFRIVIMKYSNMFVACPSKIFTNSI